MRVASCCRCCNGNGSSPEGIQGLKLSPLLRAWCELDPIRLHGNWMGSLAEPRDATLRARQGRPNARGTDVRARPEWPEDTYAIT